jgi:gliding motility-associated-like protein
MYLYTMLSKIFPRGLFVCFLFLLGNSASYAQRDTLFWFVAPEAIQSHGDRPILFRFASYGQQASILIEQPANPNFPPMTLNLPPNAATSLDVTTWINMVENNPPNTVLNYGFRIRSTAEITAYYEVNPFCACNPDIFTLKGKNALGTNFFLPFQNFLSNWSNARSGFDIVATQNNTTITITPTKNIVGHNANIPFTITLNAGQTWNGRAAGFGTADHLEGSTVVSDKPIAITINDDTMSGAPYGGCGDLMGDQIVPVNRVGDEYIVVKGYLNGPDKFYVLATANGTSVSVDGSVVANINAGQTYVHTLSNPVAYVTSSQPTYLLHTTGFGCEVGGALLPTIECTGSASIAFTRSTNEFFALNLIVQTGGQGSFTLNGNAGLVTAAAFSPVPGSNGAWMYAQINLSGSVPQGLGSRLNNSTHLFHMGIIHGGASSGCRYGYFSDYNKFQFNLQTLPADTICEGSPFLLQVAPINGTTYNWTGPNNFTANGDSLTINPGLLINDGLYIINGSVGACPVEPDTFDLTVIQQPQTPQLQYNNPLCDGDILQLQSTLPQNHTIQWTGPLNFTDSIVNPTVSNVDSTHSGTYSVLVYDAFCPSDTAHINVQVHPVFAHTQTPVICQGDSILTQNGWQTTAGTYVDNLNSIFGCDSVVTRQLTVNPTYNLTQNPAICRGQTYTLPSGQTAVNAGSYTSLLSTIKGCDSLITSVLVVNDTFRVAQNPFICSGDSLQLPNLSYVSQAGLYSVTLNTIHGCDSTIDVSVSLWPVYNQQQADSICQGQTYTLPNGQTTSQGGAFISNLSSIQGCDSTIITILYINPTFAITQSPGICQGQSYTLPHGQVVATAGSYVSNLNSVFGCDSIITTNLSVEDTFLVNVPVQICQGQSHTLPNGNSVQVAGNYSVTLSSIAGCDSIVLTQLTVAAVYSQNPQVALCQGDSLQLPNGMYISTAGSYPVTLNSSQGCDSLITTQVIQNLTHQTTDNRGFCQGGSFTLPNGQQVFAPGTYGSTVPSIHGCDSTVQTLLVEWPVHNLAETVFRCQGDAYTLPNGTSVNASGTYTSILQNQYGCDSSIQSTLVIRPVHFQTVDVNICQNQSYFTAAGPQNQSGTYVDSLQNAFGCDSVYVSELTVHRTYEDTLTFWLCPDSAHWVQGVPYFGTNTVKEQLTTGMGCDSITWYRLLEVPVVPNVLPEVVRICEGSLNFSLNPSINWTWNPGGNSPDITISDTGLYTVQGVNSYGCIIEDTVWVRNGCDPSLYIPSIFTPNGDGINDFFRAYGTRISYYRLEIFNRWGDLLFTSDKIDQGWDGNHLNLPSPVGVYTYKISFEVEDNLPFDTEPRVGLVVLTR